MAYPSYIREKALRLRTEQGLTIDEIAERLAISRTTAYAWVGHLPVPRRENPLPGTRAMQARYARIRADAYEQGRAEYAQLAEDPTFRDFVTLFIAEGTKRSRNTVAVANSDPAVIVACVSWLRRLTQKTLGFAVQIHEDRTSTRCACSGHGTRGRRPTRSAFSARRTAAGSTAATGARHTAS